MLFIFSIILLLYSFVLNSCKRRVYLLTLSIVYSVFFFSSTDLIIGIPLYIYFMCLSIIFGILKCLKIQKKELITFVLILLFMIISLIKLSLNIGTVPSLLINFSNTDTVNIEDELLVPSINFTILKHLIFYILYLVFVLFNMDLLKCNDVLKKIVSKVIISFRFLFVAIIIEFVIVNLLNGYNDRSIMEFIFSMNSNQTENWITFGFNSVCLCFNERSSMCIFLVYCLLRFGDKGLKLKKHIFFDMLGVIACFCTGSSTALLLAVLFCFYILLILFKSKDINKCNKYCISIITIIIFFICFANRDVLFWKINEFINPTILYGSAFFRRQSIQYGLRSFLSSPMVGVGIGTVYCHSGLIQFLANMGLIGTLLCIIYHTNIFYNKNEKLNLIRIVLVCVFFYSSFIIQQITSPFILIIFIGIFYNNRKSYFTKGDVIDNTKRLY